MSGADCQWQHIYPLLAWSPLSTIAVLEIEFEGEKLHNMVTKSILFFYQLQLLHLWVNLGRSSSIPDWHWTNGLLENTKNTVTVARCVFPNFVTWAISNIGRILPQMYFVLHFFFSWLPQIPSPVTFALCLLPFGLVLFMFILLLSTETLLLLGLSAVKSCVRAKPTNKTARWYSEKGSDA